jgi:flagellar protein FlaG
MRINTPVTANTAPPKPAKTSVREATEARPVVAAQQTAPTAQTSEADASADAKASTNLLKDQAAQADKLIKQVEDAVERVKDSVKLRQSSLEFQVDDLPDKTIVVTIRDKETKEVVRQIPSEEMLRISEALKNGLDPSSEGLLVKGRV